MNTRLFFLLAVLAGAFCLAFFQVCDVDVFWQLKQGEVMLDTGTMVRSNIFSHTYPDYRWVNPEWLFQVTLAAAYRLWGWAGVSALKLLLVLLLAGTLYGILIGRRDHPLLAASLTLASLSLLRFRLTERPQLVSLLFFTLCLLLVDRYRRAGSRAVWLLPGLFALWSNFHAELLLGLLTLLAVAAGEGLNRLRDRSLPGRAAGTLAAVAGLCLLASGINPQGYRVLLFPFAHFSLDKTVIVTEFMPGTPVLVPLFWLFAALTGVVIGCSRSRRDWAEILPVAGIALLGARYVREVPYLALVAAPVLQRLVPEFAFKRSWATTWRGPAAAALAAGMFVWAMRFDALLPYRWGWGVNDRVFPVAATDFLQSERLPPRLYNSYNTGGYLLFRLYPRIPVFQDSRSGAYPDGFMAELHARAEELDWPGLWDRYRLNTALVAVQDVTRLFSPDAWGLVFWDDRYAVLVRRSDAHRDVLDRLEYRQFLPVPSAPIGDNPVALAELVREMRRNQAERHDPSGTLAADTGLVLERLRRRKEARESFLQAVTLSPDDALNWAYLGRAEAALGAGERARQAFRRALKLNPSLDEVRAWQAKPETPAPRREAR